MLVFRSYKKKDKLKVLEVFQSNCPKYFDPSDEQDLIDFLENYADENYLVAIKNGELVGCGGHYVKMDGYGIAWTMFKRNAIGAKQLLVVADTFYLEIISRINKEGRDLPIYINTTQLMERIFNRYGFKTYEILPDGFGKGLDEYRMRKDN